MSGKVCIVTGANTGIGKVTAFHLAKKGAQVFLACRSADRAKPVVAEIKKATKNDKVEFLQLDLGSFKSIQKAVSKFKAKKLPLHLLVNNAGIMAPPFGKTVDGIEQQFGVNHLGHFYFTTSLLDVIKASEPARIVNLSSAAHKWTYGVGIRFDKLNDETGYDNWQAYGQSKLCNVLFTKELQRKLKDTKVRVNAVHPGYVNTELQRNMSGLLQAIGTIPNTLFAKSPENGALTQLYVATHPDIEDKDYRGRYFVPTAQLSTASKFGQDPKLAKKLWTVSEKLVAEITAKLLEKTDGEEQKEENSKDDEEEEETEEKEKEEQEEDDSGNEADTTENTGDDTQEKGDDEADDNVEDTGEQDTTENADDDTQENDDDGADHSVDNEEDDLEVEENGEDDENAAEENSDDTGDNEANPDSTEETAD